jgi:3-oxoacyl-[acyl-carrier-protein] synthase I
MSSSLPDVKNDPVYVVGLGASTPVGRDAWSSAAAVRAGISGFTEHPYMIDTAGEPMRLALAPWLDIDCQGPDRFEALLVPAIEQALHPLSGAQSQLRVALALALPSTRPGLPVDLESRLRATLSERFRHQFTAVGTFPAGHAGALLGLHAAHGRLAAATFDACLVAGVESYVAPDTLEWLEGQDQLHGAGPLNNAWGFIPGEAAGAVALVNASTVERLGLEAMAGVLSVGQSVEKNRIKTETVCIGEGLTAAFREGLAGLPPSAKITDIVCDMNGEPYRADEFGFACLRTKESFESASDFVAPADCWGDVSAASGPLFLMLATISGAKGYAKGPHAFVWASSEGGERAAALMHIRTAS